MKLITKEQTDKVWNNYLKGIFENNSSFNGEGMDKYTKKRCIWLSNKNSKHGGK